MFMFMLWWMQHEGEEVALDYIKVECVDVKFERFTTY
jgi:hypothetical protein